MKKWFWASVGTVFCWAGWALLNEAAAQSLPAHYGVLFEITGSTAFGVLLFTTVRTPSFHLKGAFYAAASVVFSVIGLFLFYRALQHGPGLVVVPITALYPAITLGLGFVFLGEQITRLQLFGIVCAIAGAILIGV